MLQVKQITVQELSEKLEAKGHSFKLIDCRELSEYEICRIEGSKLMPLSEFTKRATVELKPNEEIIIHCHHGGRSQKACEYLVSLGYENVYNVVGGIDAWSEKIDSEVPQY